MPSSNSGKIRKDEISEREFQKAIQENVEKYNESLKRRYESLSQEYSVLHAKMQKEYNENFERRIRLRELYPELDLPDPEKTKLIFMGQNRLVFNPTEEDIQQMEQRLNDIKKIIHIQ